LTNPFISSALNYRSFVELFGMGSNNGIRSVKVISQRFPGSLAAQVRF